MPTPQPGTYRKGHDFRVADTALEAVALAFTGYQRQTPESVAAELTRPELVEQAKALGIKANQSNAALAEAIATHEPSGDEVHTGGERPAPDLQDDSPIGDKGTDEIEADGPGDDS